MSRIKKYAQWNMDAWLKSSNCNTDEALFVKKVSIFTEWDLTVITDPLYVKLYFTTHLKALKLQ